MALLDALTGDLELSNLFADEAEITAMIAVEAALVEAQAEAGLVSEAAARVIAAACRAFVPDREALSAGLARDGVAVPALVRQLRATVGNEHGAAVHFGATSQDIVDTALMLRLTSVLAILENRLTALLAQLDAIGDAQGRTPLMAHTRMQAALPFTAADKIRTWTAPLEAHLARLAQTRATGLAVQLGGPIGTGSGFDGRTRDVSAALARRLGLVDAPSWHGDRTRILDIAHAFALVTGTLGKIGQDLALMAQSEVGAVALVGGGASSAMAHKQNPVGAEVLVALGRLNAGLSGTLQQAMIHENERSGAAWTLEWMILPQMAVACGAALRHAAALFDGIRFLPTA